MEDKEHSSSVSHYFKEDQKSIFDDISGTSLSELNVHSNHSDKKNPSQMFIVKDQNSGSGQVYTSDKHHPLFKESDQELVVEAKNTATQDFSKGYLNPENNATNVPSIFAGGQTTFGLQMEIPHYPKAILPEELSFQESIPDEILGIETRSNYSNSNDLTYDAWIPSISTKEILSNLLTSPPGSYSIDKSLLTMPGIAIKEEFVDPIKNLLQTYLTEEAALRRQSIAPFSVTQDDRGLRQLISAGCYHAAVNLTTQLLTIYGQGDGKAGQPSKHTAHSIQLWFTRLALLTKLRRFSLAEVESEPFRDLDAPDLYFQYYPELYGGRKGSMVPFSFRLIVAIIPQYLGKHIHALDRLSKILAICNEILANLNKGLSEDGLEKINKSSQDSISVWKSRRVRVLYSLTNCAVAFKDLRLASALLQTLLKEDPDSMSGLFAALGRLCLHLGDIPSAQEAFKRHLEFLPMGFQHDPVQGLIHSAFVSCAQNNFQDATQILQQAYKIAPTNALVTNNLSVCLMFIGKIRDAIKLVEDALKNHPQNLLHEALILNLSTMYELESSNAHRKKINLLSLISSHKGDGFNVAALKLQIS